MKILIFILFVLFSITCSSQETQQFNSNIEITGTLKIGGVSVPIDTTNISDSLRLAWTVKSNWSDTINMGRLATSNTWTKTNTFQENLILNNTTSASTTGIIYKGSNTFLHDFKHSTGATAIPNGYNLFIGENAGNLTVGSTASTTLHGSYNIGIGGGTTTGSTIAPLFSLTKGYLNIAIGNGSQYSNTEGFNNISIGSNSLYKLSNSDYNVAIGGSSLQYITSSSDNNTAIGYASGTLSGTTNPICSNSIYIGYSASPSGVGNSNELVIGYDATGLGSNTSVLGNSSTTLAKIWGNLQVSSLGGAATRYVTVAATTGQLIANDIVNYQALQVSSTQNIVAGTGITAAMTQLGGIIHIQGSGGASDISADPQIGDGVATGHVIRLVGQSDTNTVTIENGTGIVCPATRVLGINDVMELYYNGTDWIELSYNNN